MGLRVAAMRALRRLSPTELTISMHSPGVGAAGIKRGKALAGHSHRNDIQPTRLTSMDRVYPPIIVSALLLLLGATGLYLTRTADLMPHARLVRSARSASGASHGRYQAERRAERP